MDDDAIHSIEALAAALGRRPRSVHYLLNQGLRDACKSPDGSYSLSLATQWLSEHSKAGKSDPLAPLKKKQLRAKIAISAEDLLAKRLKREVASGQLIYRDEVLGDFSELLGHARPLLDALPDEVAKECPQEVRVQVLQLVKHAVERYFHKLRSWRPKGTDESDPAGSAAAL
jgi:hypothetical protein